MALDITRSFETEARLRPERATRLVRTAADVTVEVRIASLDSLRKNDWPVENGAQVPGVAAAAMRFATRDRICGSRS